MASTVSCHVWEEAYAQLREADISSARILRQYTRGSAEVYGEINPRFIDLLIHKLALTSSDVFFDIGSGIGNVVMQVAVQTGCRARGIEIRPELAKIATAMLKHLPLQLDLAITATTSVTPPAAPTMAPTDEDGEDSDDEEEEGDDLDNNMVCVVDDDEVPRVPSHAMQALAARIELMAGDATADYVSLRDATVVFINNWCFGAELEMKLVRKFCRELAVGARVVTLKDLCPRYRPGLRYASHPWSLFSFPCEEHMSPRDAVSWDSKAIPYFVYRVGKAFADRAALLGSESQTVALCSSDSHSQSHQQKSQHQSRQPFGDATNTSARSLPQKRNRIVSHNVLNQTAIAIAINDHHDDTLMHSTPKRQCVATPNQ